MPFEDYRDVAEIDGPTFDAIRELTRGVLGFYADQLIAQCVQKGTVKRDEHEYRTTIARIMHRTKPYAPSRQRR